MARRVQDISPSDKQQTLAILARSGNVGDYVDLNLQDGSISYLGMPLQQDFRYVLVDNIGTGSIRVAFNRPTDTLTFPKDGAKTLPTLNSIYVEEKIWHIRIYFITGSQVEIMLISDKKE